MKFVKKFLEPVDIYISVTLEFPNRLEEAHHSYDFWYLYCGSGQYSFKNFY